MGRQSVGICSSDEQRKQFRRWVSRDLCARVAVSRLSADHRRHRALPVVMQRMESLQTIAILSQTVASDPFEDFTCGAVKIVLSQGTVKFRRVAGTAVWRLKRLRSLQQNAIDRLGFTNRAHRFFRSDAMHCGRVSSSELPLTAWDWSVPRTMSPRCICPRSVHNQHPKATPRS